MSNLLCNVLKISGGKMPPLVAHLHWAIRYRRKVKKKLHEFLLHPAELVVTCNSWCNGFQEIMWSGNRLILPGLDWLKWFLDRNMQMRTNGLVSAAQSTRTSPGKRVTLSLMKSTASFEKSAWMWSRVDEICTYLKPARFVKCKAELISRVDLCETVWNQTYCFLIFSATFWQKNRHIRYILLVCSRFFVTLLTAKTFKKAQLFYLNTEMVVNQGFS